MPTWNSQMKARSLSLIHNLLGKVGGSHLIEDVKQKEPKWCKRMWGVKNNGAKTWTIQNYSPARPRTKRWRRRLWAGGSCYGRGIKFKLLLELRFVKRNPCVGFPNHLLENTWIGFVFCYALLPFHKGIKQDTIGDNKKKSAKQQHHKGFVLVYLVENEMPFVHHIKER